MFGLSLQYIDCFPYHQHYHTLLLDPSSCLWLDSHTSRWCSIMSIALVLASCICEFDCTSIETLYFDWDLVHIYTGNKMATQAYGTIRELNFRKSILLSLCRKCNISPQDIQAAVFPGSKRYALIRNLLALTPLQVRLADLITALEEHYQIS